MGDPDEKKFTQADVDRIVAERLARETTKHEAELAAEKKKSASAEKLKADNDKLKADLAAKDEAGKTAMEKLQGDFEKRVSVLEEKNKTLEADKAANDLKALKVERAAAGNYPPWYAERVVGSTAEEIDADLKVLHAKAGDRNFGAGGGSGGNPTPKFTRAQIKAMTPEEYEKNETAILDAMAKGEIK